MKTIVSVCCVLSLLLIACNRRQEKKSANPYSPAVVEVKGYVVPKDSMREPDVVPAGEPKFFKTDKPVIVKTNTNVFPVGAPKVVTAGTPHTNFATEL
jgi:hypothetical protein